MSTGFTVYIIAQFFITCAIIYGIAHEEKVIEFEDRIFKRIKKKFSSKKNRNNKSNGKGQSIRIVNERSDILSPTDCFDYNIFSNVA